MSTETIAGILASILTGIAALPQLIKLLKEKCADDISLLMLLVLVCGLLLWAWYGIMKEDVIIVISNSFSALVNLLILLFSIHYKRKAGS